MGGGVILINSDSEFQSYINGNKPVLVDFTASWCGPCRQIAPHFEKLSQQYADKIVFLKVDVDTNQEIARKELVSAMPTFVLFIKGKHQEQVVGADLNKLIDICRRYANHVSTFSGAGRRLSEASPVASQSEQGQASNTGNVTHENPNLSPDAPVTSLQIRLADGSRHIAKFNTTSTIGELRKFICEKTGSQPKNFNLMAGMPPKYITTDESVTLENAELEGAVIIQRPA